MTRHTSPTSTAATFTNNATVDVHTLDDWFTAPLPDYLRARLADAPTRVSVGRCGTTEQPDWAALYPSAACFTDAVVPDEADCDCGAPDADRCICAAYDAHQARVFSAAAAQLLFAGGAALFELMFDHAGRGAFSDNLHVANLDTFDARSAALCLPDAVAAWLATMPAAQAAAWIGMFLAEIQLHMAELATGTFPTAHSTGSEMALHKMLDFAEEVFENMFSGGVATGSRTKFIAVGGDEHFDDVIFSLRLSLFEDHDVLMLDGDQEDVDFAMSTYGLHPSNWFQPFRPGSSRWLTPSDS